VTPAAISAAAAAATPRQTTDSRRSDWRWAAVVLLGSLLLFVLSNSLHYGDALTYTNDIRQGKLLEPGHLLWRPLGHLAAALVGALRSDSATLWVLQGCSLLCSALAVAALWLFLRRRVGCSAASAAAATALFALSNGFWTYSFSGCSYGLSTLLLIAALACAIRPNEPSSPRHAVLAGALAGASCASWAIEVLSLPALALLLVLTPRWQPALWRRAARTLLALGAGWLLTFIVPLLLAWVWHAHATPVIAGQAPASTALKPWLASASHGIPPQLSLAQLLRVLLGWPQSFVSMLDLGQELRLWNLHERSFPWSVWMLSPLAVYAFAGYCGYRLLQRSRERAHFERGLVIASLVALAANLFFALLWQGTDLERYFPSLPFQLLLFALALQPGATQPRARPGLVLLGLLAIAWVNGQAAYLSDFSTHSYRQVWVGALHRSATGGDLLVVLGQRKQVIVAPHDPGMPKIDNLAYEIVMRGARWKPVVLNDIEITRARGGRVFLGDSLFGSSTAPRDGWSFREFPSPTPRDIAAAFLPLKSDTVAFTAGGERVWLAK
jgi:hypothetical protein